MNIYMIHGKPHISVSNGFLELSQYDYHMLLEHNEIETVVNVELFD